MHIIVTNTHIYGLIDADMSLSLCKYLQSNNIRNLYTDFKTAPSRNTVYSLFHPVVLPEGLVLPT